MKQSWTEQMGGGCYQGARLEEANDECTEDEAEAGQGLTTAGGWWSWYGSGGGCCWCIR